MTDRTRCGMAKLMECSELLFLKVSPNVENVCLQALYKVSNSAWEKSMASEEKK